MKKAYFLGLFVIISLWSIASLLINNDILIPYPWVVLTYMSEQILTLSFYITLKATILRLLNGVIISLIIALILGILAIRFKWFHNLFAPIEILLKAIPNMTYIIMAIIWLGKEKSATLVIVLVIFPILYKNIEYGLTIHNQDLREVLLIYPEKFSQVLSKILLPQLLPQLAVGLKSVVGLGFKVCVMAEIIAFTNLGIGRYLYLAMINLNMTMLFAYSIWVILIAFSFDTLFELLINKLQKKYN